MIPSGGTFTTQTSTPSGGTFAGFAFHLDDAEVRAIDVVEPDTFGRDQLINIATRIPPGNVDPMPAGQVWEPYLKATLTRGVAAAANNNGRPSLLQVPMTLTQPGPLRFSQRELHIGGDLPPSPNGHDHGSPLASPRRQTPS